MLQLLNLCQMILDIKENLFAKIKRVTWAQKRYMKKYMNIRVILVLLLIDNKIIFLYLDNWLHITIEIFSFARPIRQLIRNGMYILRYCVIMDDDILKKKDKEHYQPQALWLLIITEIGDQITIVYGMCFYLLVSWASRLSTSGLTLIRMTVRSSFPLRGTV